MTAPAPASGTSTGPASGWNFASAKSKQQAFTLAKNSSNFGLFNPNPPRLINSTNTVRAIGSADYIT